MQASRRHSARRNGTRSNLYKRPALLASLALFGFMLFQSPISAFFEATLKAGRLAGPESAAGVRQQKQEISPNALLQMQSLADEKRARTPEQRKIGSQLLFALAKQRGQTIPGTERLRNNLNLSSDGRVLVDIRLNTNKPIATVKALEKQGLLDRGGEILSAVGNNIRARVALTKLEDIARIPEVRSVRPAAMAITSRTAATLVTGPGSVSPPLNNSLRPGFESRAARLRSKIGSALLAARASRTSLAPASNVSEGDITHRAAEARNFYGVDGTGIKIGVLSDGVDSLSMLQASGDLPAVTVLPGQDGTGDEGSAMLEIVHDLAPGAQLFFATAFTSISSFAQNILDLRTAGCNIIVDDVFYFAESPFQDGQAASVVSTNDAGLITQAVNTVTAAGALYFSSAGNEGNLNDGTSGTWEGDFNPNGTPPALAGGGIAHNFGDGGQSDQATAAGVVVTLNWSDPLGASDNDYDLYILDSSLTTIFDASTDVQDGDDDPFEITGPAFANERIVVMQFAGADRFIRVETLRGELDQATTGGTFGHTTAANAFGVAAVDVATALPGPFTGGAANPVEFFSCDGPRHLFYNADSSAITPGNVSATGGLIRQKPDVAAADGVSVAAPGFSPFFGTSAAAPHAAAIAGLLLSANPALTPAQVRTALTSSALDIEAPGVDRDSGAGIVMAFQALQAIGATPVANPALGTVTPTSVASDGDGAIEPCEAFSLSIQLTNVGGAAATGVSATLASSTPGVTITTGASNYPNIPSAGSALNTTPFAFRVAVSVPCGTLLNFTLTVNFSGGTSPKVLTFSLPTGTPLAPATFSFTGPAVPIPDSPGADVPGTPAVVPLTVSGVAGRITDLNFRIDGGSCNTTVGSTTVGVDHTFANDLNFKLKSPMGTEITVINRADLNGNNFCQTLLDDQSGGPSIQGVQAADAPFTGSFTPANPLSAFNGEDPNGTWTLTVTDNFIGDTGSIRAFSLIISGASCNAVCCTLTCPANLTTANAPNQCGAVVNYPAPTSSGACGTVTCSPASGSFFPAGTTTVTCNAASSNTCSFTITVNDTQAPTITCPAAITMGTLPGAPCAVITFSATAADNCPGLTLVCTPPSGSCVPAGTTTVSCTATDARGNTASCSFGVKVFDSCLQDDSAPGSVVLFNAATGEYQFCCGTTKITGTGRVTKRANLVTVEDSTSGRRVLIKFDGSAKAGSASLQSPPGTVLCTIADRNTTNNTCVCN